MTFKNKTIQTLISSLLIVLIIAPAILFSNPKKSLALIPDPLNAAQNFVMIPFQASVAASEITQTGLSFKEIAKDIVREVLKTAARRLLQQMTKSTINWINSGFHGKPLFLENPQSFFKDIAKYEIKNIVDTYGYDSKKYPFGKDFALNIINSYKSQTAVNAEYSLNRVINDPALLADYRSDFNVGGWNGFLINSQYPQNNYIGFQMMATEDLARKLEGTVQSNAQRVQTTLQQGLGFLSPQTCPTNPDYNNLTNPWSPPKGQYKDIPFNPPLIKYIPDPRGPIETGYDPEDASSTPEYVQRPMIEDPASVAARQQWIENWQLQNQAKKEEFMKKNTCLNPDGTSALVNTTPGSVVGAQITKALGGAQDQASLAAAMGNSVSAILDTLMNHFMTKGLNAIASKINPAPEPDEWSYMGQTLGSPLDGNGNPWDVGPDEEVNIDVFKKDLSGRTIVKDAGGLVIREDIGNTGAGEYIPGAIAMTEAELKIMFNESATEPGISQMLSTIWPRTMELDMCLPGPNIGWEQRLENEKERNSTKFLEKSSDDDPNEAARAQLVYRELKFASDFFKDWIRNKMLTEIPGAILYMDEVDSLEDLSQGGKELINKMRLKNQALARLKALQASLNTITGVGGVLGAQPAPDSGQEKALISLRKQYRAVQSSISSVASIEDSKSQLEILKDKLVNVNQLITKCNAERLAAGWTNPGGKSSTYLDKGTEQNLFCDFPIRGGYDHDTFTHSRDDDEEPGTTTHPDVPYVNANDVFRYDTAFGSGTVDIEMDCNIIYKSNIIDYKQDLPGAIDPSLYAGGGTGGSSQNVSGPSGPGMCPALTTPKSMCENVDRDTVLDILEKYSPSWEGIQEAIKEVNGVYPDAYVIPHDTGSRALDKIDFGGGLIVDVITGALGPGQGEGVGWTWGQECNCGQDGGPTN